MLTIFSLAVFFFMFECIKLICMPTRTMERNSGEKGGINIYDFHFERSNNARKFYQKNNAQSFNLLFAAWKITIFFPITIWMPIIQFRPSNVDDNVLRRRTLKIYIFSETFNMVEEKREKYWAEALKLRFQRQNNRSLWPLLSNRFGFTLHNGWW